MNDYSQFDCRLAGLMQPVKPEAYLFTWYYYRGQVVAMTNTKDPEPQGLVYSVKESYFDIEQYRTAILAQSQAIVKLHNDFEQELLIDLALERDQLAAKLLELVATLEPTSYVRRAQLAHWLVYIAHCSREGITPLVDKYPLK